MPSTKQVRVSDPAQIRERIKQYLGKKINVVLSDNTVIIGELKHVNTSGITLLNMRLKKLDYRFDQLNEFYFDEIV